MKFTRSASCRRVDDTRNVTRCAGAYARTVGGQPGVPGQRCGGSKGQSGEHRRPCVRNRPDDERLPRPGRADQALHPGAGGEHAAHRGGQPGFVRADSERRMRALGYSVWLHKCLSFVLSGTLAGVAGVLWGGMYPLKYS